MQLEGGRGDVELTPVIRHERPDDAPVIHVLVAGAFRAPGVDSWEIAEAGLVDRLRVDGELVVSLVAEVDGVVVGHVALSPVTVDGIRADPPALGLAPLAVEESCRRRGIGAALVTAVLEAARERGTPFVVVLGDPAYYERCGFGEAEAAGLDSPYDAGPAFRVCELVAGGLAPGMVRYARAFDVL